MGRKNKIPELQKVHGDLHTIIPPLVESVGQEKAGQKLGLSESTINKWLRENGYKKVIRYVRLDNAS